jgi:hypothetical protein
MHVASSNLRRISVIVFQRIAESWGLCNSFSFPQSPAEPQLPSNGSPSCNARVLGLPVRDVHSIALFERGQCL